MVGSLFVVLFIVLIVHWSSSESQSLRNDFEMNRCQLLCFSAVSLDIGMRFI